MKIRKFFLYLIGVLLLIFFVLILFSPYSKQDGSEKPILKCSIIIKASTDSVFHYLGNSENVRNWSSFVDHISLLNGEDFTEGAIGSTRRCFVQEDELGMMWDEEVLEIEESKHRKLSVYDLKEFSVGAKGLATEQIYTKLNDSTTKLSFTLFFDEEEPNLYTQVKMKLGCYRVKYIFDNNLANIKRICETTK